MKTNSILRLMFTIVTVLIWTTPIFAQEEIRMGDMIVFKNRLKTKSGGISAQGFEARQGLWQHGFLPIEFEPGLSGERRLRVIQACQRWSAQAGVQCMERTNETAYVKIQSTGAGCFAHVGYNGVVQVLNLDRTSEYCWSERTIIHELGHSFDLMHEHQRPDRDQYISLSVPANAYDRDQFIVFATGLPRGSYDFESIMHYWFGTYPSGVVMSPRPAYQQFQWISGRLPLPSLGDGQTLRAMYGPAKYNPNFTPVQANLNTLPPGLSGSVDAVVRPFFDEHFYLSANIDVYAAMVGCGYCFTAWDHYKNYGGREGRSPNPWFNETTYRYHNPDLLPHIAPGGYASGFEHYLRHGAREGRTVIFGFSEAAYLGAHPDVYRFIQNTGGQILISGLHHWVLYGRNEGRLLQRYP